ncbi:hypothetical protein ADUPG1_013810 [Aduncisulcus paluster]|uniref:Uncharacterized protein n=1 Tax=Aduncisulcus paluster TaxID=2918883 RepID=A0ABQ5K897_9EUKA|nr:hypothetical protein ADUPG1_013810 [Aduncisulcus paluster]
MLSPFSKFIIGFTLISPQQITPKKYSLSEISSFTLPHTFVTLATAVGHKLRDNFQGKSVSDGFGNVSKLNIEILPLSSHFASASDYFEKDSPIPSIRLSSSSSVRILGEKKLQDKEARDASRVFTQTSSSIAPSVIHPFFTHYTFDERKKALIIASVKNHEEDAEQFDDMIEEMLG